MRLTAYAAAVALALAASAGPAAAADPARPDWPQWRGPTRDGKVAGPAWPERLNADNFRRLWRVEVAASYSGPIVAGDRVFTTETRDQKYEIVRALDRESGKELWQAKWEGAMTVPFFAWANGSWIRATPAYDQGRLFVAGMRDLLVCLDAATGAEQWRVDFVKEFKSPTPAFGFVSSPLVIGDHLYVQAGSAFVKLDKATGKVLWRTLKDEGGMYGSAFSSPAFAQLQGVPQLLVQTRQKLAGVAPSDGRVLWSQEVEATRGMNILTPTLARDNALFTSSHGGRTLLFELGAAAGGAPEGGAERTALAVTEKWQNKVQGYMSSPVVIDGHAYLHLRNQRFACLDLATGQEKWISQPFGQYWSLAAQGNRILALDERGELLLIRATPEKLDLVDRLKVGDNTWAHLAVSGDQVFVRELGALAAYQWKSPEGSR